MEVDEGSWLERQCNPAPIVGHDPKDEKVIGYTDDKIVSCDTGKIINYHDVGKQTVIIESYAVQPEQSSLVHEHRIFRLRRKTFFFLSLTIIVVMLASIIGGGVGGTMARRNKHNAVPTAGSNRPSTTTSLPYANTGLAAIQWTDKNGTLHQRVYFQDKSNKIREAGWDNTTAFDSQWEVNAISKTVKPSTPIAAVAGYPHASFNYSLVLPIISSGAHC